MRARCHHDGDHTTTTKKLRVELPTLHKKAKGKPPLSITWDTSKDTPLEIVQRRNKSILSLRKKGTHEELSIDDLQGLPDNSIVEGSTIPGTKPYKNKSAQQKNEAQAFDQNSVQATLPLANAPTRNID